MTIEVIFWILLLLVFYTYIGYGVLLLVLVKIKEFIFKPSAIIYDGWELPQVTLLIAAYNEERVVESKMKNTHDLKYPEGRLKIVWITDGSNDNTNRHLQKYSDVTILFQPIRLGKTAALNRAIEHIDDKIIVFSDANTMLNKDAIVNIVLPFIKEEVGCVAGEKRVLTECKDAASSSGEGFYWKYESFLKELDSRLYSTMGAAGELYAIRKDLYRSIPSYVLLDDFVLSMLIIKDGYRIQYCKDAYAVERGALNMIEEKKRKIRIAAGGIQSLFLLRTLLNPFKHPKTWIQYVSHRVLRWTISPIALFCLLPLNIYIATINLGEVYNYLLVVQILIYLLAVIGKLNENNKIKNKLFFVPYYFLFMNFCVFEGFVYLNNQKGKGYWEKSKRKG